MKVIFALAVLLCLSFAATAQDVPQKIYETERAFEKMVAEKGINAGLIEFLSPVGIMFMPDVVNGREAWKARPASAASLTWNPIRNDASSNGALAYSIRNSMFRPKGKDDTQIFYGHYISIWTRQVNGEYRLALDTAITHGKPDVIPTDWKPKPSTARLTVEAKGSAGDNSAGFFISVDNQGAAAAYNSYLADDAILMREGLEPLLGRKAATGHLKKEKGRVVFAPRKSFIEAGDLAYTNGTYKLGNNTGTETERGNYVQVWKLINGKWKIAADVFVPLTKWDD